MSLSTLLYRTMYCYPLEMHFEAKSSFSEREKEEGKIILLEPVPYHKEITACRNRIRPVDSGIRAVE